MTTGRAGTQRAHSRRSGERGAALFIVVLVIMLVSAIGVFAVRVSSLVQLASGYNRRATSAQYIAELATKVMLAEVSDNPAQYHTCAQNPLNDCVETAPAKAVVSTGSSPPGCCAVENPKVLSVLAKNNAGLGTAPLGQVARPDLAALQAVLPNSRIEISAPYMSPTGSSGTAVNNAVPVNIYEVAFTTIGNLAPFSATGTCNPDTVRASVTTKVRAFVRYQVP